MFRFDIKQVPRIVTGVRLGLLGLAAGCLFVVNLPMVGLAFVLASLAIGFAMRRSAMRVRVVRFLTGIDISSVIAAKERQNRPHAGAMPGASRNLWADPIPMSPDALAEIITREAQPAIRLKRHWPPQDPFSGNSFLGGVPQLPDDMAWPINSTTGLALHHLAQIDLSEMPLDARPEGFPNQGTLWFFADIDEELCWDTGPDSSHSAVLYSPGSVQNLPSRAVPDTLPEVDHSGQSMTGTLWGFRGPKFSIYPRWPVTGHKTVAWAFSDEAPEGVTDPKAYFDALNARELSEKTFITGAARARDADARFIARVALEKRRRPDGTPFTFEREVYQPDLWGGMFPYSARFGALVLRWMLHEHASGRRNLEQQLSYTQNRPALTPESKAEKRAKIERLQGELAKLAPWIARIDSLLDSVQSLAPEHPLDTEMQSEMDALMTASFDASQLSSKAEMYVRNAAIDFVGLGMSDPDILSDVPADLLRLAESTTGPAHEYTSHFLLGPKSSATNPTAGEGVRLAQFDSDYALRFMFCDCGIVDFWIDPNDLAQGRWDRAWAATAGG